METNETPQPGQAEKPKRHWKAGRYPKEGGIFPHSFKFDKKTHDILMEQENATKFMEEAAKEKYQRDQRKKQQQPKTEPF